MNDYRIDYRFNKHGRKPHVFDVIDDTGHCIASFSSLKAEEAKTEARNFVAGEKMNTKVKNKLIVIGWMGLKFCYLNVTREEAIRRYKESGGNDETIDPYLQDHGFIKEFEFEDEFYAYDAWSE